MNRPFILGIDPGISGAVAIYDTHNRAIVDITDLPLKPTPNGQKQELCASSFCFWLEQYSPRINFAVIEAVHAMPNQGVTSMFRFGEALGILKGVVTSYMIPIHAVSPAVWKTQFRLSKDKLASRQLAKKLFPEHHFFKNSEHNKAEAALLAVYGSIYLWPKSSTPSN